MRFTFDRTPFRRMLRALLAVGGQTRTMRLLPPQQATPPPLSGMQLFLPAFASSHTASAADYVSAALGHDLVMPFIHLSAVLVPCGHIALTTSMTLQLSRNHYGPTPTG